jgi:hypothetical protein
MVQLGLASALAPVNCRVTVLCGANPVTVKMSVPPCATLAEAHFASGWTGCRAPSRDR